MATRRPAGEVGDYRRPGKAVLFLCLLADRRARSHSRPFLAEVGGSLDVSTGLAGQLRTIAGLVATLTALTLSRLGARLGLGRSCSQARSCSRSASASAAAPASATRRRADPVGAAIGILTTTGMLAAASGSRPSGDGRPLLGADRPAGGVDLGHAAARRGRSELALRLARLSARRRPARRGRGGRPQQRTSGASGTASLRAGARRCRTGRWLAAEALDEHRLGRNARLSRALFVESYGASTALTGIVLALGAGAYVSATFALRRLPSASRGNCFPGSPAAAVATAAFGVLRPSLVASAALARPPS